MCFCIVECVFNFSFWIFANKALLSIARIKKVDSTVVLQLASKTSLGELDTANVNNPMSTTLHIHVHTPAHTQ